jgi:hypothetical protein
MQKSYKLGVNADRAAGLTSITAISFSLTFVAVSLVFLTGLLPTQLTTLSYCCSCRYARSPSPSSLKSSAPRPMDRCARRPRVARSH